MNQSQYLVHALQGLQHPAQFAQPQPMDLSQMAQVAKHAQAYQQANPGGSYLGHNLMDAGRNLAAAPGNATAGIASLAQRLQGGQQLGQMPTAPTTPYAPMPVQPPVAPMPMAPNVPLQPQLGQMGGGPVPMPVQPRYPSGY